MTKFGLFLSPGLHLGAVNIDTVLMHECSATQWYKPTQTQRDDKATILWCLSSLIKKHSFEPLLCFYLCFVVVAAVFSCCCCHCCCF